MPTDHNDQMVYEFYSALGEPFMSVEEFADLGVGESAFIRSLTLDEAQVAFPFLDDLPKGVDLFALIAADGTPLMLTNDKCTAINCAIADELEIAMLH